MRRATVLLPHGVQADGSWLRTAQLRELNGYDEEQLSEMRNASAFSRSKALLERVVDFVGNAAAGRLDLLAQLTVGDTVALILQTRRIMFGDYLHILITCPACGGEMASDLTVSQLLQPPLLEPKKTYQTRVEEFMLMLRPVTCADLERLRENNGGMSPREKLVRSCVISSQPQLPPEIEDDLLGRISSKLGELDPQADLVLDLACPNCKHRFQVPFFPEDFILREIDAREPQFEREVHWLAFNYHWSEDTILSLSMSKRKRYVELINATLSGDSV
jgi:hypothetical protein